MKRLDDLLNSNGFFETYNARHTEHFNALFGDKSEQEINVLDNLFSDVCGDFPILRRYESMDAAGAMERITDSCDARYYELWQSYKNANLSVDEMDINAPYSETRTITEQTDGTSNRTDTSENAGKVYAYDGAEASDSDLNSTSGASNGTEQRTRDFTEKIKKTGERTAAQIARSKIDYAKNNIFLNLIFTDILELICGAVQ